MKGKRGLGLTLMFIIVMVLMACSNESIKTDEKDSPVPQRGHIYLYGEAHGIEKILDRELELWYNYYHEDGMRHLFVELPYYTSQFLNIWMKSDSDEMLEGIYKDWEGSLSHSPSVKEFYKEIKEKCPETIFHGTDVGHQYDTTGERYLKYLEENNLKNSEEYILAEKYIEQGIYFYKRSDYVYRENKMAGNFIEEFDKLNGESIMGIYGTAHTGLDAMNHTNAVPCMAKQIKKHYGDNIYSEDLSWLSKDIDPIRVEVINVKGKDYNASYFEKENISGFKDYTYREFWRLENSYKDFKHNSKTGEILPYDNYPMAVDKGQVFVIDYTKKDGTVIRRYYRSDGYVWKGSPATEGFSPK